MHLKIPPVLSSASDSRHEGLSPLSVRYPIAIFLLLHDSSEEIKETVPFQLNHQGFRRKLFQWFSGKTFSSKRVETLCKGYFNFIHWKLATESTCWLDLIILSHSLRHGIYKQSNVWTFNVGTLSFQESGNFQLLFWIFQQNIFYLYCFIEMPSASQATIDSEIHPPKD